MKVDKAVSTNKDILNEFNASTIKYESLLKSLIEQKFTAIKRECEQNQKSPNSKAFLKRWRKRNRNVLNERRQCVGNVVIENKNIDAGNIKNDSIDVTEKTQVEQSEKGSRTNQEIVSECIQTSSSNVDDMRSCTIDEMVKSDTEIVSNEGTITKPIRSARRNSNTSKKTSTSTPIVEFNIEQEQHNRSRILEARSISAQCSPIFPRQSFDATNEIGFPHRMCSRKNASHDSVNTDSIVQVNEDMEMPSCSTMAELKLKRNSANETINKIISNSSFKSKTNSNKLTLSELASTGVTTTSTMKTPAATTMSSSTIHNVSTNCILGRVKHHGSDESHKIRKFRSLYCFHCCFFSFSFIPS